MSKKICCCAQRLLYQISQEKLFRQICIAIANLSWLFVTPQFWIQAGGATWRKPKRDVHIKNGFVLLTSTGHVSIIPNQNGAMAIGGLIKWENVLKKYSLLNNVMGWRSCPIVSRGCVSWSDRWPLRRDKCSSVLIGRRDGTAWLAKSARTYARKHARRVGL